MECILSLVAFLCGRLKDAWGNSVQAQAEGVFSFLGDQAGRAFREWQNKVIPQTTDAATLVGAEESLRAIRGHLLDNEVDVVGIVGMGGVGKTTLLKKINNDFYSGGAGNFSVVIFVTVSREGDDLKVQKKIAKRLRLEEQTDSEAISDALRGKRYLLLLDDVWGAVNLSDIGIPFPNKENKCKIVLATRSSEDFEKFLDTWCRPRSERARVVIVRTLDEARSWELFRSMMDHHEYLDDPSITPYAEKMVEKCDGLPLALVTMGRTMATATSSAEWRKAERQLEESPYRLPDMHKVQLSLMFSIDRLKDQGTLLSCFLYCSLFPEDNDIDERDLIEYWIGEGLLDGGDEAPSLRSYGSLQCARDDGEIVIKKLKDLRLLETGRRCVKMHNLLRELALELGKREPNRFMVRAFVYPLSKCNPINNVNDGWEEATRLSVMHCKIQEESFPEMPCCPRLSTLLMYDVSRDLPDEFDFDRFIDLPDGFFTSMRSLVVLDLSYSLGRTIPTSICSLSELRFLSLMCTDIRSLPKELGNLVKLRQLDLSGTYELEEIPQQAILRLSNLQVLNMIGCRRYEWGVGGENINVDAAGNKGDMQLSVSDVEGMDQLKDFRISVFRVGFLSDSLLNRGDSLLTSITELQIENVDGLTTNILRSALQSMTSLRHLNILLCAGLTGELILDGPMLSELERLHLRGVPLSDIVIMRDGINEEGGDNFGYRRPPRQPGVNSGYRRPPRQRSVNSGYRRPPRQRGVPLQKLKTLILQSLPNLERICDDPPQGCLPSLEHLVVDHCPILRTLPLGPRSKIQEFYCDQEWWERLQWRQDQGDARRAAELALRFY